MERYSDRTFEPGTLTRDQFITWMKTDAIASKMVYDALERTRTHKAWREAKDHALQRIKEDMIKKYKRQSTRDKYTVIEYEKWVELNRWRFYVIEMKSFAWSIRPWENGGCYHVDINNDMDERLGRIYDESLSNKYFLGCSGWYIGDDQYVHLILSEELEAEWKADEKRLSDAINRFYANSNYWGD